MRDATTKCLFVGRYTVDRRWWAAAHSHEFTEVIVVLSGKMNARVDGEDLEVEAGDVLYYAPGAVHSEWVAPKDTVDFVYFTVSGWSGRRVRCLVHDSGGRLRHLAQWLLEEWRAPYGRAHVDALAHTATDELLRLATTPSPRPLDRIRLYIRENAGNPLTIETLACRAGMSKSHFIREYRNVYGVTPMQDVRRQRIDDAIGLLLRADLPIKAIARQTGFCDEFYFSRVFRRLCGTTPAGFRRRHAQQ